MLLSETPVVSDEWSTLHSAILRVWKFSGPTVTQYVQQSKVFCSRIGAAAAQATSVPGHLWEDVAFARERSGGMSLDLEPSACTIICFIQVLALLHRAQVLTKSLDLHLLKFTVRLQCSTIRHGNFGRILVLYIDSHP